MNAIKRTRKRPEPRAIVPVWAQRIAVERQGESLLIKGWGRIEDVISTLELDPARIAALDLLRRFKQDALRTIGKDTKSGDAGVYRFADADSDEKLIGFCEEFGPVGGDVVSVDYEDDWTITLSVSQGLEKLRDARKKFAAAVELVCQVNRHGRATRSAIYAAEEELYRQLALEVGSYGPGTTTVVDLRKQVESGQPIAMTIAFAHSTICGLLNSFPPDLAPVNGEVIELPKTRITGIEDVLYYQIRRDYLAQREIGICKECGGHFSVFKHGTPCCSDSCSRALRNRKYWDANKKRLNSGRRKKHGERK
jgi:hypothetical protein